MLVSACYGNKKAQQQWHEKHLVLGVKFLVAKRDAMAKYTIGLYKNCALVAEYCSNQHNWNSWCPRGSLPHILALFYWYDYKIRCQNLH
jgi:hypothetical protein